LLNKIKIPVPNVSSCAFRGQDVDQMFITTGRQDLSEQELKNYPAIGRCFWIKFR
jgi:sugar lactone lactonase YvrE